MTDPHARLRAAGTKVIASLADVFDLASHGTVRYPEASGPDIRREGAGDHGAPTAAPTLSSIDRRRLLAAADDLSRALGRVDAALAIGRAETLPDAIAAARSALAHLIAVR